MGASSEDVDDDSSEQWQRALAQWGSGWQDGAKFVRDIFSMDASKYSDEDFRKAAVLATSYTHLPKAPKTLEDYALDVVNLEGEEKLSGTPYCFDNGIWRPVRDLICDLYRGLMTGTNEAVSS